MHILATPIVGREIRFTNVEQEEPIGELSAYNVTAGVEPAGSKVIALQLTAHAKNDSPSLAGLRAFISGRYPADEQSSMLALPTDASVDQAVATVGHVTGKTGSLPLVHVLIPDTWDELSDGLDGIAIDLPALPLKPTNGDLVPFNIKVKDPLWPLRDMLDFTFSIKPGEARTLWLDLRDRLLPAGKGFHLAIASAAADFGPGVLEGVKIRLIRVARASVSPASARSGSRSSASVGRGALRHALATANPASVLRNVEVRRL